VKRCARRSAPACATWDSIRVSPRACSRRRRGDWKYWMRSRSRRDQGWPVSRPFSERHQFGHSQPMPEQMRRSNQSRSGAPSQPPKASRVAVLKAIWGLPADRFVGFPGACSAYGLPSCAHPIERNAASPQVSVVHRNSRRALLRSYLPLTYLTTKASRVGFAYALDRKGGTVVRGSFGLFYIQEDLLDVSQAFASNGVTRPFLVVVGPKINNPNPQVTYPNSLSSFPSGAGGTPSIVVFSPTFRSPYVEQANAALERQFGSQIALMSDTCTATVFGC